VSTTPRPDGRLRALYAVASAGLDVATFVVQAIWLLCLIGLIAFVAAIAGGVYHAIF